jgi:polysaccharide pyruvyl transferase WcaK-like protein
MTIYIFGYYDENNLGDNQFKYTIPYALEKIGILPKSNTKFINHQTINSITFKKTDVIILGGGDVLTYFFLDKLQEIYTYFPDIRLIAFSVGISYISELSHPILLNFESFYIRTFQDVVVMKKLFGDKIFVIPDTSFLLPNITLEYRECQCELSFQELRHPSEIILVCLNQHLRDNFPVDYFAKLLDNLSNKHHIIFLPFCTGRQDDSIIHNDIANKMKTKNYTLYKKTCLSHTITLFKISKYSIVMRFHALLFSYIWNTNFFVILETRKTINFCLDVQLNKNKTTTLDKIEILNKENLLLEFKRKIKYADWVNMF